MQRPASLTRLLQGALALLMLPVVAGAYAGAPLHTGLKRSEPAKDSRLTVAPTRVSLWFTARPQLAFSKMRLVGPMGDMPLDTIVADTGDALHATIPHGLLHP